MLRAYVVDDEPLAVKRLMRMLEATRRVELAGSTSDPDLALAFLRDHAVDVLFLDIQMPGLTGFELLEQLDQQSLVIFTTAYDRYALEAFEVVDPVALLGPVQDDDVFGSGGSGDDVSGSCRKHRDVDSREISTMGHFSTRS